jgi:hypothetical protein
MAPILKCANICAEPQILKNLNNCVSSAYAHGLGEPYPSWSTTGPQSFSEVSAEKLL